MPGHAEQVDQHDPEPEDRDADPKEREKGRRVIQGGVLVQGRIDADGDRHGQGEGERRGGQRDGVAQPVQDQGEHRLPVRPGPAEVALRRPLQPLHVSDVRRLIQPVDVLEPDDVGRSDPRDA